MKLDEVEIINVNEQSSNSSYFNKIILEGFYIKLRTGNIQEKINDSCAKGVFEIDNPFSNALLKFVNSKAINNKFNLVKAYDSKGMSYIIFQWVSSFDAILHIEEKKLITFSHFNSEILSIIFSKEEFTHLVNDKSERKLSGIIVSHERPYHYFYDILPSYNSSQLLELKRLRVFCFQGGDFLDLKSVLNAANTVDTLSSQNLNNIGDNENSFFVKIGAYSDKNLFPNKAKVDSLDNEIRQYIKKEKFEKLNEISICVNISDHKRKLINLEELLSCIISYYLALGKKVSIYFDGWTAPISTLNQDLIAIEKENKVANALIENLPGGIEYYNCIGKTFIEKLSYLSNCDLYFGCIATASLIPSRILNIKSLCHFSYLFTDDIYIHGEDTRIVPKQITFTHLEGKTADLYRVNYSIQKDLFYVWFQAVLKNFEVKQHENSFPVVENHKSIEIRAYTSGFSTAVSAYKTSPSNRNAGLVARIFLDNKNVDLSFRSNLFLNFIDYLDEVGSYELSVKMVKHLLSAGSHQAAVDYLSSAVVGKNKTNLAINELKNIYYREAVNYWRTGRTLYGLNDFEGDLYSSAYTFIKFIKKHRDAINFNDFSVVSQLTNAFLMLSTNRGEILSAYIDDLLNFFSELHFQGYCNQITLDLVYYDIYVWFGHFTVANSYRQRAIRQCIDEFNIESNALEILLAYAEIGLEMPEEKFNKLQSVLTKAINKNHLKLYNKYYNLNVFSDIKLNHDNGILSAFGEFLKGKSVAVVGPYDDGVEIGDIIDKFDVVIRINNFRDIAPEEKKYIGSRTDVGYFTHQMISSMASVDDLKDIKFIRLRNGLGKITKSIFSEMVASGKISPANLILRQFYKGASVIQTIIFDILDYNPSSIKLFKMNFYLEKELYSKSYKENISLVYSNYSNAADIHSYRSVCFAHDFLPQFLFTKNLYNLGYIDAQDNIKEILSLSASGYMQNMQYSHRLDDNKLLPVLRYIPVKAAADTIQEAKVKVKCRLNKEIKAALRVFDFCTAYDKLRQVNIGNLDPDIANDLWKAFDFNWLIISSLYKRNWNITAKTPRSLTWSEIDKIYDVDDFSAEDKMLFIMQASEQQEFISAKSAAYFLQKNIEYLYDAVGDVFLDIGSNSGYRTTFKFKHFPSSVKQALARFDLLQWFGDFKGAYSQRLFALEIASNQLNDSAPLVILESLYPIPAKGPLIDTGNFEFDALLNGKYEQFIDSFKTLRDEEVVLSNLIQGKSVAIVGPAPTGEASGLEIDGFDVVIRFNYTGGKFDVEFGSKTTISAYNKVNSIYFEQYKVNVPFSELEFYFIKEPVKNFEIHKKNSTKVGILPRIPHLLHKTPMATVDVLYHVLKFNPRKIKIFKHTLLISGRTHADSYGFRRDFNSIELTPLQKLRMTISGHDLLSHHSLLKHLYKLNIFEADAAFDKVLNLSTQAFSDELQRIYGQ